MCFFFKIVDVGMQEWLNTLNLIYVFFHLRKSTHGCFIPMYDKIHYKKKKNLLRLQYNQEDFPCGSDGEESACNAGDPSSVPGSGRASGKRNHNPLRYSCLENPMDRGAWRVTVHRVTKSLTQLSDWHFSLSTIKTRYPAWYLYLCLSSRFYLEPQNYLLR